MLKSMVSSVLAVAVAFGATSAAQAQSTAEPFIGVTGGYHTVDVDGYKNPEGAIFGVVGGVDVPLGGGNVFIGAEGNYNFGTGDIDEEYGAAVRLGTRLSPTSKIYLKGGYQEVNFDVDHWAGVNDDLVDDSDGGFLAGLGADFDVNKNVALRLNADTIEFETARVTAGVAYKF